MKIIVKHDRDDKGWIITKEQQFADGKDVVFSSLAQALIAARAMYPGVYLMVDERTHSKMGNGMVMIKGDAALMPVEWK